MNIKVGSLVKYKIAPTYQCEPIQSGIPLKVMEIDLNKNIAHVISEDMNNIICKKCFVGMFCDNVLLDNLRLANREILKRLLNEI